MRRVVVGHWWRSSGYIKSLVCRPHSSSDLASLGHLPPGGSIWGAAAPEAFLQHETEEVGDHFLLILCTVKLDFQNNIFDPTENSQGDQADSEDSETTGIISQKFLRTIKFQ